MGSGHGFYAIGKYETPACGLNQIRLAQVLGTGKLEITTKVLAGAVDLCASVAAK